jgi:hypothetical protein
MLVVEIHNFGDVWTNRDQVIAELDANASADKILFHTRYEGVSLKASGVLDVINKWVADTNRDPSTIQFHTPNQYEKIPYKFANKINPGAHFFKSNKIDYRREFNLINTSGKLFGFFVGRYTAMRNAMALDILSNYKNHSLLSVMKQDQLDSATWWDPQVSAIESIDNRWLRDQYHGNHNTNQSLLDFYNDFQIEIVAETMTLGESFFPTEKTVRPIMGSKPFLIHAPINYLANLRNLGFCNFSELWSVDYDQYEGIERWNRMNIVIASIIEQGYDCNLAQEIVQYNYNHLQKIIAKNG